MAGDIHSFDAEKFKLLLAAQLVGIEADAIHLIVTPASILVTASISTQDTTTRLAAVRYLGESTPARLTSDLQLSVEAVTPPTVTYADREPQLSPSPIMAPTPAAPSRIHLPSPPDTNVHASSGAPPSEVVITVVAVAAAACVAGVCILGMRFRNRRLKSRMRNDGQKKGAAGTVSGDAVATHFQEAHLESSATVMVMPSSVAAGATFDGVVLSAPSICNKGDEEERADRYGTAAPNREGPPSARHPNIRVCRI